MNIVLFVCVCSAIWFSAESVYRTIHDDDAVVAGPTIIGPEIVIPESYLNPPSPPPGGIVAVLEGVTDGALDAAIEAYLIKYYPLVSVDPGRLSEVARIEYSRQVEALEKEMDDLLGDSFLKFLIPERRR